MSKKYELVNFDKETGLWQIRALRDFGYVKTGDLGGLVSGEHNLSHDGACWVYGNAIVSGNAQVWNQARVYDEARIFGDARVYGNARVSGTTN